MQLKNYDRAVAELNTADTAKYILEKRAVMFSEADVKQAQAQTKIDGIVMSWTFKPTLAELVTLLAQGAKKEVVSTLSDTHTLIAHTKAGWWLVQQLSEANGQPLES